MQIISAFETKRIARKLLDIPVDVEFVGLVASPKGGYHCQLKRYVRESHVSARVMLVTGESCITHVVTAHGDEPSLAIHNAIARIKG